MVFIGALAIATSALAAPTVSLVKDIRTTGPEGSSPSYLTNVGGRLFFVATDLEHGTELWTSDGTTPETKLVKDIGSVLRVLPALGN